MDHRESGKFANLVKVDCLCFNRAAACEVVMGKLLIELRNHQPEKELEISKKWTVKSVIEPNLKVSEEWCEQIGKETLEN